MVQDVSRGGVSMRRDSAVPSRTDVEVDLPGAGAVSGRIVESRSGRISLASRQGATTLGRVDMALDAFKQRAHRIAA